MENTLVNVQGPTASYPGDPNDFSGSTSTSWDWNKFYGSTIDSLGGLFGGIGQLVGATRGNQVIIGPGGQPIQNGMPQQQGFYNPQQPMNWTPIIAIGVVVLIIIVMIVLLVKSGK